tara:strand:- start:280 stop:801 length:522 start_codon:yes stop_codon:yes gene_type:complete
VTSPLITKPSILAIDPGPEQSAWIVWQTAASSVIDKATEANATLIERIREREFSGQPRFMIIEKVESFGMEVGASVFETVYWTGRFCEAWRKSPAHGFRRIGRKEVKLTICQSMKAKDKNIRWAIIDRFGGKEKAIGKKATPGPLYGVVRHEWSALALAVTWQDQRDEQCQKR